jgi:hypothetical protein
MANKWEVWHGDEYERTTCRRFRSLAAAERYARGYVAASAAERFGRNVEIISPYGGTVGFVRLDPLGRVWMDVMQTALI